MLTIIRTELSNSHFENRRYINKFDDEEFSMAKPPSPFGYQIRTSLAKRIPEDKAKAMAEALEGVRIDVVHCAFWSNRSHWFVPRRRVFDDFCVFVRSGRLLVELDGERRLLKAGECLLLPEGRPHAFGLAKGDGRVSHAIVHCFARSLDGGSALERLGSPFQSLSGGNGELERIMDCVALYERDERSGRAYARNLLSGLLAELARKGEFKASPSRRIDPRIMAALRFMDEHATSNIGTEDAAKSCGLRQTQFRSLFKSQLGHGPAKELLLRRLRAACRLLSFSDATLRKIALESGFGSEQYFCDVFKRSLGCRPGEYREKTRLQGC